MAMNDESIPQTPEINDIGFGDLMASLSAGFEDYKEKPSHVVFLAVLYPLIGLISASLILDYNILPMLYPLAAGFALIGPVISLAFYEISRRREQGEPVSWKHALRTIGSDSIRPIALLGLILGGVFLAWLTAANLIYSATIGPAMPDSLEAFAQTVLFTPAGHQLLLIGNVVGFFFALLVLVLTVVSFPMLLDKPVGARVAVATSFKAFSKNPMTLTMWGFLIAISLVIGSIPLFIGLAVVLPVLGHATWHLYRRLIPR